ncbi:hypothetical protein POTOM_032557 [Populus tomentosa]|uniref:Uncharacterized protein n=1 Tax=Populus tomentosa TaxID=118781 RepID=A0A8X7Z6D1_POPTO|nr:hypothetical protein POTOM_032557 [Populus tomentosa]
MDMAGDPDIVSDCLVPLNATKVGGTVFTFTVGAPLPAAFKVSKVSAAEFPARIGQSDSLTHYRVEGPVHFQYRVDAQEPALAISAFVSASAGTVSIPTTLFAAGIDDNILAKAIKTGVATILASRSGLAPTP